MRSISWWAARRATSAATGACPRARRAASARTPRPAPKRASDQSAAPRRDAASIRRRMTKRAGLIGTIALLALGAWAPAAQAAFTVTLNATASTNQAGGHPDFTTDVQF